MQYCPICRTQSPGVTCKGLKSRKEYLDELGLVDAPHESDDVMEVAEVQESLVAAVGVHCYVRTHQGD